MRPRIVGTTVLLVCAFAVNVRAQNASLRVEVRAEQRAVVEAAVVVKGMTYRTGADGTVTIDIPAGAIEIVVAKEGFAPASVSIELRPDERRLLSIELQPQAAVEEHVTVAATRTDKRIDDQAMRVETLDREEIEEKMMMTPGDIVMMLNEMGGLRVQASSPSLGAATVRIQGMRGRYTRVLSDGLPLFGEQAGSFGLLQIPPSDLGRVEVIKGVASSLYGAGAMGGVVNLVSRRPGTEAEQEVLLNRSSRGATDGVFWYAAPLNERWSATLLAGGHGQTRSDANSDGWADLPKYARLAARPRVFWDDHAGRSFFATAGVTLEDRSGGTVPGHVLPATGHKYEESLGTRRYDGGVVAQTILKQQYVVSARASITYQHQDHRFDEVDERAAHTTVFAEATVRRAVGKHTLVAGAALERDAYRPEDPTQFRYTYIVPGLFVQDDIDVSSWLSLSASTRVDSHNEFGWFASPRIAVLLRRNGWSSRTSLGTGFFAPTPLTEETEAAGLSRLVIRGPLRAERARSASFDLTRTVRSLSATMTVFLSSIHDPIEVDRSDAFLLRNLSSPLTNRGLELLTTWRQAPFSLTATYSYVRSTERVDDVNQSVPLTPRHSAGLVGMWEREGRGRVGLEWYYTGRQRLDADPFRDVSRAYSVFGALVERRVGRYRLFVNAENLANVRQTDWEPLLRRSRGVDGRWTVDAWAPLDGRTINGGVRVAF
jgi:outer membrane receptor for ferrienterochelin and colicins